MEYTINLLTAASAESLPLPAITVAVFAVAFILYVYVAKAINSKKAPVTSEQTPKHTVNTAVEPVYTAPLLTGVEEKEAAVIMAIVSDKSGIPLNRLAFKSIKLMEDK